MCFLHCEVKALSYKHAPKVYRKIAKTPWLKFRSNTKFHVND